MRNYLILTCLLTGCASADPVPTDTEETPLAPLADTVTYTTINGFTNLPSANDYFCHPTKFQGSGAHSQSVVLQWGVVATGGTWSQQPGSSAAIPNDPQNIGFGSIKTQCDKWHLFHGSGGGLAPGATQGWNYAGGSTPQAVSGSVQAYYKDSVCWLSFLNGLSNASEKTWIDDTSNPWVYVLNSVGFKSLTSSASCAWLGRPLSGAQWLTATIPQSPFSSYGSFNSSSSNKGVCLIMSVEGNLDDGSVEIVPGNQMMLRVTGGVSKATAMCFPY
jgi:hypothetical protein